jgi:uncharacterized protein involved in response to NO
MIKVIAMFGLVDNAAWLEHQTLHILAVGVIGGLILAMIVRVSLGHSGREVYGKLNLWPALASVLLAALLRGVTTAIWPQYFLILVNLSAILWVLAFSLFVVKFSPILLSPRVDGHPG